MPRVLWWSYGRGAVSYERGTPVSIVAEALPGSVCGPDPPWRQPRGKLVVSLVNSHTNATRIGWHLWEIDLRFAPGLPQGWFQLEAWQRGGG